MTRQLRYIAGLLVLPALAACSDSPGTAAVEASPQVVFCRLLRPQGSGAIAQASDLCFGRVGPREGLWLVCDRNGADTAGRIFLFKPGTLATVTHRGDLVADEEFHVSAPAEGWQAFAASRPGLDAGRLEDLRRRVEAADPTSPASRLDLEAVAVGRGPLPPHERCLFAVSEEPYSLILQLHPEDRPPDAASTPARLVDVFGYLEADNEHGTDVNDGLEGLAWTGRPGLFWWAEEGTCLHAPDAHPRLFFLEPRLGLGRLEDGCLKVQEPLSHRLTAAVRGLRTGPMQTLNALTLAPDGTLLAVDRNGGRICRVDPAAGMAAVWLDLHDIAGLDLRALLADFPDRRRMPYVSIEGIAVDDSGAVWLVDDPAMPEPFRRSCLVRLPVRLPRTATHPSGGWPEPLDEACPIR